ncbi:Myb-like domain [Macleaya cordata]|uniref:Myb-like domain n=1 Tax=Macleaya cordata TaxID=56857 RepID=A0A200QGZ7_MACCD|nr:Myb-like domain [Macleaya cordata]
MSPEQLSLTVGPVDGHPKPVISNGGQTSVDGTDDGNRPPRLPRWTRHEILVLIQGKKVAENRVRRGRTAGSAFGSNTLEPKWASVSSYCKRHGVNRGPVQCRKRWSNLAGDFKKIKEWESQISEESESFWVMRNDLRRERKLPGFFDREVYDILDGGVVTATTPLAVTADGKDNEGGVVTKAEEEGEEVIFDSGRTAAADDGLFSDFEQSGQDEKETVVKETSPTKMVPPPMPISGTANENQQASNPEKASTSTQEGCKRRRLSSDGGEDITVQDQLIKVLERNSRMLTAQLEAQNVNCQLDRDQRTDHANSLVAVLSKLADALGKIADKL